MPWVTDVDGMLIVGASRAIRVADTSEAKKSNDDFTPLNFGSHVVRSAGEMAMGSARKIVNLA